MNKIKYITLIVLGILLSFYFMISSNDVKAQSDDYNDGYEDGYTNGYNDGLGIGYDGGYEDGYFDGNLDGLDNGFDIGIESVYTFHSYLDKINPLFVPGSTTQMAFNISYSGINIPISKNSFGSVIKEIIDNANDNTKYIFNLRYDTNAVNVIYDKRKIIDDPSSIYEYIVWTTISHAEVYKIDGVTTLYIYDRYNELILDLNSLNNYNLISNLENSVLMGLHAEGYEDGYSDGYNSGVIDGYDDGLIDGYDEGFDDGQYIGYSQGYNDGALEGLDQNEAYNQGIKDAQMTALGSFDKWFVPAVIVIIILGGFVTIIQKRKDGDT